MKRRPYCDVILAVVISVAFVSIVGAEQRYLNSNGIQLHCTDNGRGTPVLLIHGYAENAKRAWQDSGLVEALVKAGFRVITYDNRGHGQSDKPHSADGYGMEMVRDVVRVLDHLKIKRAHVVGYSMGAVIANKLRDQEPERLISVTLAGYGEPPTPEEFTNDLEKQIEENLRRLGLQEGNDPRALGMLTTRWSEWNVAVESLHENKVPTLALIGADDVFLADSQRLAEVMSTVRVAVVPGDHATARSQPEFRSELVSFLQTIQARVRE